MGEGTLEGDVGALNLLDLWVHTNTHGLFQIHQTPEQPNERCETA